MQIGIRQSAYKATLVLLYSVGKMINRSCVCSESAGCAILLLRNFSRAMLVTSGCQKPDLRFVNIYFGSKRNDGNEALRTNTI
jgi:hypothetical protein